MSPIERQIDVGIKSASTLHAKTRVGLVRFDESVAPLACKFLVYSGPGDRTRRRRWSDGVEAIGLRRFEEALADTRAP